MALAGIGDRRRAGAEERLQLVGAERGERIDAAQQQGGTVIMPPPPAMASMNPPETRADEKQEDEIERAWRRPAGGKETRPSPSASRRQAELPIGRASIMKAALNDLESLLLTSPGQAIDEAVVSR